jgi:endonuclease G
MPLGLRRAAEYCHPDSAQQREAAQRMDISHRVRKDQREIAYRAFERWKGFQPSSEAIRGARPNLDGTVPLPSVAAVTPTQRKRYEDREKRRAIFESTAYRQMRLVTERQIGATLDFADLPPNDQALKAGRPVCRIVTLGNPGIVPEGFATGFLVAPDLILTNHHVFRTPDEAQGAGAQFLYERTHNGLRQGAIFALESTRFFVNHKGLDYAVVAVSATGLNGEPLSQFQFLPLIAAKGKILKGDPVNIIQHLEGRPKQYATVNNQLLDLRDDGFLLYETDTLEGSSGAPVFNQHWETIGLHHCGVPLIEEDKLVTRDGRRLPLDAEVSDSDLVWIANEGVRISALVASLADQRLDRPEQQHILDKLIETTKDPLRIVDERSPLVSGQPDVNAFHTNLGDSMSQNIFQFTGPVTVYTGTPASAIEPKPEAPVAGKVAPPEVEFREKRLKFDENYKTRTDHGYKVDFLGGWNVPPPGLDAKQREAALLSDSGDPWLIPYYHYSLVMNRDRRLLVWAASNVNYSTAARRYTKTRKEYGGENWRLDPRVALAAPGLQIEDEHFYAPAKKIDRGHIVRREDGAWGSSAKEAEFGNSDTYHWTNCTPQSEAFNQSGKSGIWGQFEDHIQREVKAVDSKMSVFAGPVLNPNDPEHGYDDGITILVPMEFWKVVVCVGEENGKTKRYAYGFVFDQTEPVKRLSFERMDMDDFGIYQMPLKDIAAKTGLVFDDSIIKADVLTEQGANESIRGFKGKRIRSLDSIVLR